MKTEKLSANILAVALPDSERERLNAYRFATRVGARVPPEGATIRKFIKSGLDLFERDRDNQPA